MISKIRRSWAEEGTHPKRYRIEYTGRKIYFEPDWMMEFMDEEGVRRFFRMEDQGPKADLDTLRFLQTKLNQDVEEEGEFLRGLQKFINIHLEREERRKRREREDKDRKRRRDKEEQEFRERSSRRRR